MKERILSAFVAFGLICGMGVPVLAEENETNIYVSASGDDNSSGTKANPLKTLQGARDYIRTHTFSGTQINVVFEEGIYRFNESVEFDRNDSGNENLKIKYTAENGANVVFSGAKKIPAGLLKKVTDENILNKVGESARDNLFYADLSGAGIEQLPQMQDISLYRELYGGIEYVALFDNDKEQPLSQWPNGDDEYVSWVSVVSKGSSELNSGSAGGKFVYAEDNPSNWTTNVKDIWLGWYPGYNYRYERNSIGSIDTAAKTIKVATRTCFGIINEETQPWKAFNILEEIDMPGEWYIDRTQNRLYYYRESNDEPKLEMSVLEEPFVRLNGTDYVEFSGITFEKCRGNAIETTCVENIGIFGCTFDSIGCDAIKMSGSKISEIDSSTYIDAAKDCTFDSNIFNNIGGRAALINGGNINTLESSNIVFSNNYVFDAASKIKNRNMIEVNGCGTTVANNNISSGSFQGIRYQGNNHKILNNELYNLNKASDDAGVIYSGRKYIQRGNEIAYNFLHDSGAVRNKSRGMAAGIYWDDSMSGQYAHHNIIEGVSPSVYSCGQANVFEKNTVINSQRGIRYNTNYQYGTSREERETAEYNAIKDNAAYTSAYPEIAIGMLLYKTKNALNKINDNLIVNSESNDYYNNGGGSVSGNEEVDTVDFADAENLDYRVKTPRTSGVLDTSYDIEKIGNTTDVFSQNSDLSKFNKHFAANSDGKTLLSWDKAMGANQYRVVVAEDEDMNNIVKEETFDYNFCELSDLPDSELYWTVYAINTSREYAGEWQCSDGVSAIQYKWELKNTDQMTEFPTTNLIENGGFETGDLSGWQKGGADVFSVVSSEDDCPSAQNISNGVYALNAKGTGGYLYQEIDAAANMDYVLNLTWSNLSPTNGKVRVYAGKVSDETLLATVGNNWGGASWYSSTTAFNSGEHEKLIIRIDTLSDDYFCLDGLTLMAAGGIQCFDMEKGYSEGANVRSKNFAVTDEKANNGKYSLKLNPGNGYSHLDMGFALLDNQQYWITFDYYIESGSLGYAVNYSKYNEWSKYTENALKRDTLKTQGSWQTFSSPVWLSGDKKIVHLAFQNMSLNTVAYIDNIRLVTCMEKVDSIKISGSTAIGGMLSATVEHYNHGYNFQDPVTYQWQISEDKAIWQDISGAGSENYEIRSEDAGKFLRLKVSTYNRYLTERSHSYYSHALSIPEADGVLYRRIVLSNSDGKIIDDLSEVLGEKLNVNAELALNSTENVWVSAAIYDKDGRLSDIASVWINAKEQSLENIDLSVFVPDELGSYLKIYVWNENMKPLDKEQR